MSHLLVYEKTSYYMYGQNKMSQVKIQTLVILRVLVFKYLYFLYEHQGCAFIAQPHWTWGDSITPHNTGNGCLPLDPVPAEEFELWDHSLYS